MKYTTESLRDVIALWCQGHTEHVRAQFVPDDESQEEAVRASGLPKNWRRRSKERVAAGILRGFNCYPLDDQLRAYVTTTPDDSTILSIEVIGE